MHKERGDNSFLIKVSVVVSVFNSENYLKECLDSITDQTLKDIEIIIVDDGSTDSSPQIIKNISRLDKRVRVISQPNFGAAKARNAGIDLANGEYLVVLDSDDIFDLDMLNEMYSKAKMHDADIVVCPYRNIGEKKDVNRGMYIQENIHSKDFFSNIELRNEIFQLSSPAAWNKLFKLDHVNSYKIRFQNLKTCNDLFFSYFSLATAEKISILNSSFVSYRFNSGGGISRTRGENYQNIFLALGKLKHSLIELGLYDDFLFSFVKRSISSINYECSHIYSEDSLSDFIVKSVSFLHEISLK